MIGRWGDLRASLSALTLSSLPFFPSCPVSGLLARTEGFSLALVLKPSFTTCTSQCTQPENLHSYVISLESLIFCNVQSTMLCLHLHFSSLQPQCHFLPCHASLRALWSRGLFDAQLCVSACQGHESSTALGRSVSLFWNDNILHSGLGKAYCPPQCVWASSEDLSRTQWLTKRDFLLPEHCCSTGLCWCLGLD